MPRLHDPVDVAKELLFELRDKPDPSLNDIEALERIIQAGELARDWAARAGITDSPIAKLLQPFEDKYELARQGETNGS